MLWLVGFIVICAAIPVWNLAVIAHNEWVIRERVKSLEAEGHEVIYADANTGLVWYR